MRRRSRSLLLVTAGLIVVAASAAAMTNSKLAPSALRGIVPTSQATTPAKKSTMTAAKKLQKHIAVRHARKHLAHAAPSHIISVPMDEVRVVQFSQPVSTVYVGNPMIADVNTIDDRHAFILGKAFGETNIIALDGNGKQVVNDHVSVFGHTGAMVTLNRGAAQVTYTCAGSHCETVPTPGDDATAFKAGMEEITKHMDAGLKSAAGKTASNDNPQ